MRISWALILLEGISRRTSHHFPRGEASLHSATQGNLPPQEIFRALLSALENVHSLMVTVVFHVQRKALVLGVLQLFGHLCENLVVLEILYPKPQLLVMQVHL